ncbi:hypothetical protein tb265_07440 [Gemmatimonadetes bacterium T265]|nr:hypothetical protein tb265_07440 [Gemmatimonadetes bacterium T265]
MALYGLSLKKGLPAVSVTTGVSTSALRRSTDRATKIPPAPVVRLNSRQVK